MSTIEEFKAWLIGCPQLKDYKITVDFIEPKKRGISLSPEGEELIFTDLAGVGAFCHKFNLLLRDDSSSTGERLAIAERLEKTALWLLSESAGAAAPVAGMVRGALKTGSGSLLRAENSSLSSVYKLSCRFIVEREGISTAESLILIRTPGNGPIKFMPLARGITEKRRNEEDIGTIFYYLNGSSFSPDLKTNWSITLSGYRVEGDLAQELLFNEAPGGSLRHAVEVIFLNPLTGGSNAAFAKATISVIKAERPHELLRSVGCKLLLSPPVIGHAEYDSATGECTFLEDQQKRGAVQCQQ